MPPPRHPSERDGRKVARAVGDAIEYRYPDVADADDRDGVILRGAEDQVHPPKLTVAFSQSSYILMTYRVVGAASAILE